MNYESGIKFFFILILASCFLIHPVFAQTIQNGQMQIHLEETTPTPTLLPIVKPETPKPNVIQEGGTMYFSTSSDIVDYGPFSPTNPILRTMALNISSVSPFGFQIVSFEDHPLSSSTSATIPDTSCDNGLCKETNAAPWDNTLTYGFGYNCASCEGFNSQDEFKQFADTLSNEFAQTILEGTSQTSTQVTFKINIAGSQDLSVPYENTLTFIAVPRL